jgi:hypothetical protein
VAGESIGIIDLDAVLKPDIPVKLDGQTYKLPGDPPTEILLTIVQLSEKMEEHREAEDADAMLQVRSETTDAVTDLFALRQEVDEGFGATLADTQISELVAKLFAHYYPGLGGEDDDDAAPPTSAEPAEAEATNPKPRSSRRSPPRSGAARRKRKPAAASASSKSSAT